MGHIYSKKSLDMGKGSEVWAADPRPNIILVPLVLLVPPPPRGLTEVTGFTSYEYNSEMYYI